MSNQRRAGRRHQARTKGQLVERVVAALHVAPGVEVKRNVRLPSRENPKRKREIDVLLSSHIAGHAVNLPIECRNRSLPVGTPQVDAVIGKLEDIGLSRTPALLVSASGFTRGAVERAVKAGIRPMLLEGLTQDRLASATERFFNNVIYLLPVIGNTSMLDNKSTDRSVLAGYSYYSDEPPHRRNILDVVWRQWFEGKIPMRIGSQHLEYALPQDPSLFEEGELPHPKRLYIELVIQAVVVSREGSVTVHSLRDASTLELDRRRIDFAVPPDSPKTKVHVFESEESLREFLVRKTKPALTIGRIPLPRILFRFLYWPPTARAMHVAREIARRERREATFEEVESGSLLRAWELFTDPAASSYLDELGIDEFPFEVWPKV